MSEFKQGQIVTFRAYEVAIKARVIEVLPRQFHVNGEPDSRQFYRLKGVSKPLNSHCTGGSIMESVDYIPWEQHPDYPRWSA